MPKFDQTGPQGQGPMTGRGLGSCRQSYRKGYGCQYGMGKFSGRAFLNKDEEIEDLEEEAKNLEADLEAIKERITELKK